MIKLNIKNSKTNLLRSLRKLNNASGSPKNYHIEQADFITVTGKKGNDYIILDGIDGVRMARIRLSLDSELDSDIEFSISVNSIKKLIKELAGNKINSFQIKVTKKEITYNLSGIDYNNTLSEKRCSPKIFDDFDYYYNYPHEVRQYKVNQKELNNTLKTMKKECKGNVVVFFSKDNTLFVSNQPNKEYKIILESYDSDLPRCGYNIDYLLNGFSNAGNNQIAGLTFCKTDLPFISIKDKDIIHNILPIRLSD